MFFYRGTIYQAHCALYSGDMKRRIILLSIVSLALGVVITSLFMSQVKWKQLGDCANQRQPLPSPVRRVDCSGVTYGFPVRFLESDPSVDINTLATDPSQVTLEVSSTSHLDKGGLLLNIAIWSVVSGTVIAAGQYWFSHRNQQKLKSTTETKGSDDRESI